VRDTPGPCVWFGVAPTPSLPRAQGRAREGVREERPCHSGPLPCASSRGGGMGWGQVQGIAPAHVIASPQRRTIKTQASPPPDVYSPPRLVTFLCLFSQSPFGVLPAKSTKSNCFEPWEALDRAATRALSTVSPTEREAGCRAQRFRMETAAYWSCRVSKRAG
jgi:hypothetical protein